ncbi:MAG: hypothetical protein NC484_03510 [Alloprevotella sp.]|nr:hypothetical protein [Alloprevotella sp.]
MVWRLDTRADGALDFISLSTGKYIMPVQVSESDKQIALGDESPSAGWILKAVGDGNVFTIVSGDVQLNQTEAGNSYKIFNYGGGINVADKGCQFKFSDVTDLIRSPLGSSDHIEMSVPDVDGVLYGLYGRRAGASPQPGVYVRNGRKIIL